MWVSTIVKRDGTEGIKLHVVERVVTVPKSEVSATTGTKSGNSG